MIIERRHLELVRQVLANFIPHVEVWAFGSRICGSPKPHSDLDLALVSDAPIELSKRAALGLAFEESDLPFRVDIVELGELPSSVRAVVVRAHEVIQQGLS